MILSNHILSGALIAKYSSNLWFAFPLGILAHLLLDSLPHWDYPVENLKYKMKSDPKKSLIFKFCLSFFYKESLKDIIKVAFDLILGLFFASLIFLTATDIHFKNFLNFSLAILGSLILDILIIPSEISTNRILKFITKIHTKIIHTKYKLKKYPCGFISQILVFMIILYLVL